MAEGPANSEHTDLNRLRDSPPGGHTIFISPTEARDRYHTHAWCPHVSSGFDIIEPDDDRHDKYSDELEQCLWCRSL